MAKNTLEQDILGLVEKRLEKLTELEKIQIEMDDLKEERKRLNTEFTNIDKLLKEKIAELNGEYPLKF